jgi:hypothetical protein
MSLLSDKIEINKDALVPAQNLKNNNLQRRHLKEIITEIIKNISQELILAHREGRHDITTNIPTSFSVPNMSNTDSQRFIWASIIEELLAKDYRVWISPSKDICRMKITWMSPEDETEIKHQMNLIIKNTKNNI